MKTVEEIKERISSLEDYLGTQRENAEQTKRDILRSAKHIRNDGDGLETVQTHMKALVFHRGQIETYSKLKYALEWVLDESQD